MAAAKPRLLDMLTDRLNERIDAVEHGLEGLGWGVSADVPIGDGYRLRWSKHDSQWALRVVTGAGYVGVGDAHMPLVKASRKHRIAAVAALPSLLSALDEQREAEIAAVDRAIAEADCFLLRLDELRAAKRRTT